jgi:predicted MarR family transcription regulator
MAMLFDEHEAALALAVPSPRSWITPIVEYRNGFTHHPVIADQQDLDKDALLRCTYVLRILLELCFLKSAGLDEAAVAALAGRCEHYRQIRSRFFVDDTGREPDLT